MDNFQKDIDAIASIEAVPTILDVVCRTTGMGFAAVARVTEDRWIACGVHDDIAFGLKPGGELKVETTICNEIRGHRKPVVINHVAEDAIYRDHHTPKTYGIQSYISMPIILADGRFFGTLCAIDPRPARLQTPEVVGMFRLFAELIAFHLDALAKLTTTESHLEEERKASELRDQFIAVLGHDLRNPLGAITSGAIIMRHMPLNPRMEEIMSLIQGSAARMAELIDNVLDFARGRLGGGLVLHRTIDRLEPALRQVIAELHSTRPERRIETDFSLAGDVDCDSRRVAQLFSNLLGNALAYGAPDASVKVRASNASGIFELSVTNAGTPIPPAALKRLFQPFARGTVLPHQQGLGLGLYIVHEIAKAHGGTIDVTSTAEATCFTFRLPLHHTEVRRPQPEAVVA